MLFTVPLFSKSTFLGSLLNKCRQVIKQQKPTTNNKTNNNITLSPSGDLITTNRPTLTNAAGNVNNANISTTTTVLKTYEEKIGLPPRPKKPPTPYLRYVREIRPKLLAENPNLKPRDLVQQVSRQWPMVSESIKKRLQEEYKRDQKIFIEERVKYDAKLTPEQIASLKQMKQDAIALKERRQMRDRVRALGRPKRPSSAFLLFIKSERQATPQLPQETFREWHNKCTAKWKRLTKEEKASFMAESKIELEKYKKKLAEWESEMMKLGNLDVVRSNMLIVPPEPKTRRRRKVDEPPAPSKTKKQ